MNIIYSKVKPPGRQQGYFPVELTEETMKEHFRKVMEKMREQALDALVIYGDREHGANFAYLTGFEPRFEEALLVLHRDGKAYLVLGNENLKMCRYSFVKAELIHCPYFSLPCQPMIPEKPMKTFMEEAGLKDGMKIGCCGWKYFTSACQDNQKTFDIPSFIIEAIREAAPGSSLVNAGGIFLDPANGARHRMNGNEIAHYEFAAGLASSRVREALDAVAPGKTEMEIAHCLAAFGQPITITTIAAAGERFTNGVVFPRNKKISLGDKFSLTLGLRGGSSSRAAIVAESKEDLPEGEKDYIESIAAPYFKAAAVWYETVGIGVSGSELYETIEKVLPKEQYHWTLNPGHYTDQEEWSSSPVYRGSGAVLGSGMLLQMDIIPSVPGYSGVGAEDGIAIADEKLRSELREKYPETWRRFQDRREYMKEELGIRLKEEILPMSDLCGYLRPLLLNHEYALKVENR